MSNKLNPFTGRQFIDASGNPYSGAKLFIYTAGSASKVTTTKDLAGTSDHTNPIILNSRGEPGDGAGAAQAIWQAEGVTVKLVLAPSNDTDPPVSAIDSWDNIAGINDTVAAGQDQWVSGATPTYISTTSFSLVGDQTSDFHVGRRVKTTNTGGTIYSTIITTAYTTLTTVTIVNDSGTLDSGLSAVSYGLLEATNEGISSNAIVYNIGPDIASATALSLPAYGNYSDVTGTTTITSIAASGVLGTPLKLHFDGILTLTHNATDLILPGAANITTAAGDEAEFIEYAAGDWRCVSYSKANGLPLTAVTQAFVALEAVGQSELKTTSGEVSRFGSSVVKNILPGGAYGFYPRLKSSSATAALYNAAMGLTLDSTASYSNRATSISTSYASIIMLASASFTITAEQTYVTASPPYNLGDGEIGCFIFAIIDNITKKVESVYSATEAPWHYNGPTDIRGKLAANGKKYRTHKDMSGHPLSLAQARLNQGTLIAYNEAFANAPIIQEEITQDIKQADMNLIPHPFMANDLTGKTVVMLDPVSDLNFELDELSQHEEFNINELLHDGYLEIDSTDLNRSGPPDILIPSFRWKNTS